MSVAAATQSDTKAGPMSLWTASMAGGIFVLAALAALFYGVPQLWEMGVSPWLIPLTNKQINGFFLIVALLATVTLLAVFGMSLAGPHPQKGLRGGIFLAILTIFVGFFLLRGMLGVIERMSTKFDLGQAIVLLVYALGFFFFFKFLRSDRMTRWAHKLEEAGWFEAKSYKRNQGVRVRRMTMLAMLLLFGSGIYTMLHNNVIGAGDWKITLPYTNNSTITLLPDLQFTVPLILCGLALWFAWRIVNFPVFADFLVATEAEINKVSWTPRARLVQDTIVVLITVFLITMFLFVVDVFWGFFLSRSFIGVLPSDEETKKNQIQQVITNEW